MGISLKKGQGVSLKKESSSLSRITIGLGWDVAKPKGLLSKLFGKTDDYDLDAICFMLGEDGCVHDLGEIENGRPSLQGGDVIFYNSMKHPSGAVQLTGDNRTGDGDGDDEQIIVQLDKLPPNYQRLVFSVSIYDGIKKGQNFGSVENAFIRAVDNNGKELVRYDISGNASFESYHSIIFAEVVREEGDWQFKAVGNPHPSDRFVEILKNYLPTQ
jgi:stress response protein SCP2